MSKKQLFSQNSFEYQSRIKLYECVMKSEKNEQKKKTYERLFQKFKQAKDADSITNTIIEFGREAQQKIKRLRLQSKHYKMAFDKLTSSKQEYHSFKRPDITDYFFKIQQKINLNDFKKSYLMALLLLRPQLGWTMQFVKQLVATVEEKKTKDEENQKKKKQIEKSNQHALPFTTNQQKLKPSNKSSQKLQFEKADLSIDKIQKGSKKKIKIDQHANEEADKKNTNKQPHKQKNQDQSVSISEQLIKEQKKKNALKQATIQQQSQKSKQPKNRVKALKQYLQKRKDFGNWNQNKLKEISEYLNHNLQKFMKLHLANLLNIAKLSHPKVIQMPEGGSQFTYFSKAQCNLKIPAQIQVSQDTVKIIKVNYRSKMQLYSMLKVKENVLENNLMKKYAVKKDDDKKGDKKIWQYLLRTNQHQKAEICLPEESTEDRITIALPHLRFLFQNHPLIRKSYLMMSSYI